MSTLFEALLSHHGRQLKPIRYTEPMIAQLQSFFEDVVLENSLKALVIENLPLRRQRMMREIERVRRIGQTAHSCFLTVSPEDELICWFDNKATDDSALNNIFLLQNIATKNDLNERYVIVADDHFSALLVAVSLPERANNNGEQTVIYSFDPDVAYTALQYLQARYAVEHPDLSETLTKAIHHSMPKAISLSLTLKVSTKLANLWQEQTGREIAVNRIASAIRRSLELDDILQTAVDEVGLALSVEHCALLVESEDDPTFSIVYVAGEPQLPDGLETAKQNDNDEYSIFKSDLEAFKQHLRNNPQNYVRDGVFGKEFSNDKPQIVVPLSFLGKFVGVLFVQTNAPGRIWQESEILLLQTVADQVAIAIKHARLYIKSQQEALRDDLTGIFNRRYFELQFEREFKLAERKKTMFGVVMMDIDKFKKINDTHGHQTGDSVLKTVAQTLSNELRAFDTIMRYGGEEFVVILPQTNLMESQIVAERLRSVLEKLNVPTVKKVTASFGIAVYPNCGTTMDGLLKAADDALYQAKREGRNRVCVAQEIEQTESDEVLVDNSIVASGN